MVDFLQRFGKKGKVEKQEGAKIKNALRNKYFTFQKLLAENNRVLTLMSEMEEKLGSGQPFDREYLRSAIDSIVGAVHNLIEHVNSLSGGKYELLRQIHATLSAELDQLLAARTVIPASDHILPLAALTKDMALIAGRKNVHLGEIGRSLALPVPEGFAISSHAFLRFMEHNGLSAEITRLLAAADPDRLETLTAASERISALVQEAELPEELARPIAQAVDRLGMQVAGTAGTPGRPLMVSVRSSALHEDGAISFAGQYATFLNVPAEEIPQKYKEVITSLFSPKAIFYSKTQGLAEDDMVMAVGVMRMLNARVGGVMYTRDPNTMADETMIINAMRGLGKQVVDGAGTPHCFVVAKADNRIIERKITEQKLMLVCRPEGGIEEIEVPAEARGKSCLADEHISELADYGRRLEQYYGCPQDIEWAVDMDNRLYILQSRRLYGSNFDAAAASIPQRLATHPILLDQGVIACKGIGHGKAFVLKEVADLQNFPPGSVLVARQTETRFVTIMPKAAAIITEVGGATGHMASLAREFNIPTILDASAATRIIEHGQEITVDAVNGIVYSGRVEELIAQREAQNSPRHCPFRQTSLYRTMVKALARISPLHLVDPESENFRQESCRSLHDITRFIHEKAMVEIIFMSGRTQEVRSFEDLMCAITFAESGESKGLRSATSDLHAGIPMEAHVLDIDGGLKSSGKKVAVDDITSIPFRAFVKGLREMRWPAPKPPAAQGIHGMLAPSAPKSGEAVESITSKSYAIISRNYMNFSLKLGYHFSMVEAYASENRNDNYLKYFFKGGGAAPDRRLRRVRLISQLLEKMDFRVSVTEDVLDGLLVKFKLPELETRLEIMGRLTVYTKQLDMAMFNDAVTDMFVDDFVRAYMKEI